jgi:hypothetical protein
MEKGSPMNRRTFTGKGLRAALAAVLGGSAAVALNEQDAAAYCSWNRIYCGCKYGYYSYCTYAYCCPGTGCTGFRNYSEPGYC